MSSRITTLRLTDSQTVAAHEALRRIGQGMCMARQKRKSVSGVVPAPDTNENVVHELVRQLAIPAATVRAAAETI